MINFYFECKCGWHGMSPATKMVPVPFRVEGFMRVDFEPEPCCPICGRFVEVVETQKKCEESNVATDDWAEGTD